MSQVGSPSPPPSNVESLGIGSVASVLRASPNSSAVRVSRSLAVTSGCATAPLVLPACATADGDGLTRGAEPGAPQAASAARMSKGRRLTTLRTEDRGRDQLSCMTPDCLASGEIIPENAVGGVQHGERGATNGVAIGQIATHQSRAACAALRAGDNDDVGIEGAHELHAHQFEAEDALREGLYGLHGCFRAQPEIADRAGLSLGLADEPLPVVFQLDLNDASSGRRPRECEGTETQPLAAAGWFRDFSLCTLGARRLHSVRHARTSMNGPGGGCPSLIRAHPTFATRCHSTW